MWTPGVDLMEKDDEYVLHAELPGMKLDDIHIQFWSLANFVQRPN
jgi:HSP20 family molecular chaperone IbpA